MTEQQKNAKIIEEVLTSKDYENEQKVKELEKQILGELPKCQLHPTNVFQNKKCRHCQKIREEFEQRKQAKLEELNALEAVSNDPKEAGKVAISQLVNTHNQFPANVSDLKHGNLPDMLRNNILSSQYFKDLYSLKTLQEVVYEIQKNVTYSEPWVLGANSVPSSLFCCLYKLMLMHLTEK